MSRKVELARKNGKSRITWETMQEFYDYWFKELSTDELRERRLEYFECLNEMKKRRENDD